MAYLKMLAYEENSETKHSLMLYELSRESIGMSGRALKKIPFLAHALYSQAKNCTLTKFLRSMHLAILWHKENCFDC
jgi:hypothetical protein